MTVSKIRERKPLCSRPPQNVKLKVLRRITAVTAKKCTVKCDARAEFLFSTNLTYCLFAVLVDVAVVFT